MSTSKPRRIYTHWVQDERKSRTMKNFRKAREMWSTKLWRDRLSSGFASLKQVQHLGPPKVQARNFVVGLKQLAEEIRIFKQNRGIAWQAKFDLWNVEPSIVDEA